MSPMISIIVPVYNAAPFLKRCISSILVQSYEAWELILVDDGSTDESGRICDDFASEDSRIKVIHQSNGGVSVARNRGLDCASGEWITFSDADDWLEGDALENYIKYSSDCDIVRAGYKRVSVDGAIEDVHCEGIYVASDKYDMYQKMELFHYFGFLWNSFFRKTIIGPLRFPEGINWCEDHIFSLACCSKASAVKFIPDTTYNYYLQPSSSLSYPKDLEQVITASELELKAKWALMSDKQREQDIEAVQDYYSKMNYVVRTLYNGKYDYNYRKHISVFAHRKLVIVPQVKANPSSRLFYQMRIPFGIKDCFLRLKFARMK